MTALEIALDYAERGWATVPVPFRKKKPVKDDWQELRITADNARRYFNGDPQNIGVLLGQASGGLCDVDLDCPEAVIIGGYFLKKTLIFGRPGKRDSHWLYKTNLAGTEPCAAIQFKNPLAGNEPGKQAMLLELRIGGGGKGAQTVFPGSTHESGEAIVWENSEPVTELPGAVLKHQCHIIAAASLLARNFPEQGGRHDAALLLGGFLHRCGIGLPDIKLMVEAIGVASHQPRDKIKDMIRAAEDAAMSAAEGRKACGRTRLRQVFGEPVADKVCEWLGYNEPGRGAEGDNRPEIVFYAATPHRTADAAEEAIINAGFPVMHRAGALVMPHIELMHAYGGGKTQVAVLRTIESSRLIDMMSRAARWSRWSRSEEKALAAAPPETAAKILAARAGEWSFPRVSAIISTPTLRPDGSILSVPGYDSATQLYLAAGPEITLPPMPEKPTRADAEQAISCLEGLLVGFPFADDETNKVDRAVALSLLMTPVIRSALDVAPMHIVSAPTYGSGKTYLINIAAALATGQRCPVTTAGKDETELEKRIDAALIKSQPILAIDNVNGLLFGNKLAQAVEQRIIDVRPLGTSNSIKIDNNSCVFATGCNISVRADMVRRTLRCLLDPQMEEPEKRTFAVSPLDMALADRGKYIAAVMTVARAYLAAACPEVDAVSLASFGAWSRFVQRPLIWLGKADPAKSIENTAGDDPEWNELHAVLPAWHAAVGAKAVTVKELRAEITTELTEAILEIAPGKDGDFDAKRFGWWLRRMNGRMAGELRLSAARGDTHKKQARWKVCGVLRRYAGSLHSTRGCFSESVEGKNRVEGPGKTPTPPQNPASPGWSGSELEDVFGTRDWDVEL
jgi:hypothetical protein